MSLHTWCFQGPRKPSSCATFMLPSCSTLTGAELSQPKKILHLHMQGGFDHVRNFATLWTVACQASLLGRSQGKNTGVY